MSEYASGVSTAADSIRSLSPRSATAPCDYGCAMCRRPWHHPFKRLPGVWMRYTRTLCVIGVSVWSAVVAVGQPTASGALSGLLRAHLQNERFGIVSSIRGLPLGVRDELQALFDSRTLDIAEPGAEFQMSDAAVNPQLPSRRLVAAGCSTDYHCLVYYERGGIARGCPVRC